jgi:von Willebrand factor type A domain
MRLPCATISGTSLIAVGLCFSCSSPPDVVSDTPSAAGSGGSMTIKIPTGAGGTATGSGGSSGLSPTAEQNCGNSASTMTQLPADLLLVLDRSGSMTNSISDDDPCDPTSGACAERWATMVQAMRVVLATSPTSIHWGLKFFSTPGIKVGQGSTPAGCVVQPGVEIPLGTDNADAITSKIAATTPNYNTPTRAAIETAVGYLGTVSDGRSKYILLATDGQPNCPVDGDVATASDLPAALDAIAAANAAGIKVYVIGVGPSAGNLDDMAEKGGTGKFYPALSPQSLATALSAIVGNVASCVYTMASTPPDPKNLGVYLDKQLVPESASDGWTLGNGNSVVFGGATCDRIKAGNYKSVEVLFGCPGSTELPQTIP